MAITQLLIISYLTGDASTHVYQNELGLKHTAIQTFNCVAFGRLGELCAARLKKGHHVVIVGALAPPTDNAAAISVHVNGIQLVDEGRHSIDVTLSDIHCLAGKGTDGQRSVEELAETVGLDDFPILG
jgi:hypothetical protein